MKAGSLKDRLCSARPTLMLAVPLVWEKNLGRILHGISGFGYFYLWLLLETVLFEIGSKRNSLWCAQMKPMFLLGLLQHVFPWCLLVPNWPSVDVPEDRWQASGFGRSQFRSIGCEEWFWFREVQRYQSDSWCLFVSLKNNTKYFGRVLSKTMGSTGQPTSAFGRAGLKQSIATWAKDLGLQRSKACLLGGQANLQSCVTCPISKYFFWSFAMLLHFYICVFWSLKFVPWPCEEMALILQDLDGGVGLKRENSELCISHGIANDFKNQQLQQLLYLLNTIFIATPEVTSGLSRPQAVGLKKTAQDTPWPTCWFYPRWKVPWAWISWSTPAQEGRLRGGTKMI